MSQVQQRNWGQTRIAGGRHAFRLGLMMRAVEKRLAPDMTVLDAGCGDGALSLLLLQQGFRVTAVDAAEGGLMRLRAALGAGAQSGEIRPDRADCCRASLDSLPLPDYSFDAVVSGEVLEHLPDDRAAVREFHRVLKPGGLCFITVPANPKLFGLEDQWAGHLRRYTQPGLAQLFTSSAFTVISLHHWGWPVTWLYNRVLYQAWLKRQLDRGAPNPDPSASIGGKPLVMKAMFYAFSLDRLFFRIPCGIGLIGVFQKSA